MPSRAPSSSSRRFGSRVWVPHVLTRIAGLLESDVVALALTRFVAVRSLWMHILTQIRTLTRFQGFLGTLRRPASALLLVSLKLYCTEIPFLVNVVKRRRHRY